jgi:hypothetical protein
MPLPWPTRRGFRSICSSGNSSVDAYLGSIRVKLIRPSRVGIQWRHRWISRVQGHWPVRRRGRSRTRLRTISRLAPSGTATGGRARGELTVSTDIAHPPLVVQGGTGTACQSVRFRQPISCVPGLRPTARIYLLASLGCHSTKGSQHDMDSLLLGALKNDTFRTKDR